MKISSDRFQVLQRIRPASSTFEHFPGTPNSPEPPCIKSDGQTGVNVTHMKGREDGGTEETQWCIADPSYVFGDVTLKRNAQKTGFYSIKFSSFCLRLDSNSDA